MKKLIHCKLVLFASLLLLFGTGVQKPDPNVSVLDRMTLEEKIAQLLILRVNSTDNEQYNKEFVKLVARVQPGGVCFFKGNPTAEASLTRRLQAVSNVPLFVSIDGE